MKLKNPPIREAVIDVHIDQQANITELKEWGASQGNFKDPSEIRQFVWRLQTHPDQNDAKEETHLGWRFDSKDNRVVIQLKVSGFTVSLLRPYLNWEELHSWADRVWSLYSTWDAGITRIGVRFINEFPTDGKSAGEIFVHCPQPPLSWSDDSFVLRHEMKRQSVIAVTTSVYERENCVLDIDAIGTDLGWQDIGQLRELKNELFFKMLHESVLAGFDQ